MKQIIGRFGIVLLIVCATRAYGATWARSYPHTNGFGGIRYMAVQPTTDHGYLAAGYTSYYIFYLAVPYQALITKLDSQGTNTWAKVYPKKPGNRLVMARCAREVAGGYVVSGLMRDLNTGQYMTFVLKYSPTGKLLWQRLLRSAEYQCLPTAMVIGTKGEVVIAGQISRRLAAPTDSDFWILALHPNNGSLLWQRAYGLEGQGDEGATSIDRAGVHGFVVAGNRSSPNGSGILVLKLDDTGELVDQILFDTKNQNELVNSIIATSDGSFVLAGSINGCVQPYDLLVSKFTLPVDPLKRWVNSYSVPAVLAYAPGGPHKTASGLGGLTVPPQQSANPPSGWPQPSAYGTAVAEMPDGNYVVAGACTAEWNVVSTGLPSFTLQPEPDGLLIRIPKDSKPPFSWCHLYGRNLGDEFLCLEALPDPAPAGSMVVGGYNKSYPNVGFIESGWGMHLDQSGNTGGDMSCLMRDIEVMICKPTLDVQPAEMVKSPKRANLEDGEDSDSAFTIKSFRICEDVPPLPPGP